MKQIYFDSDEEITAIISKLESIQSNRIALIPPKRSTTLQSVVNLKLIQKAITANDNELVVITKDPFILNIASQLKILTAPNLETEPEVPQPKDSRQEMPSAVIEGAEATEQDYTSADEAAKGVATNDVTDGVSQKTRTDSKTSKQMSNKKTGKNVPDFDRFKKYVLVGLVMLILLGGFLWWALFIAPNATIRIQGVTRDVNAETNITLDPKAEESNPEEQMLAATLRQEGRTLSTTFEPTGTTTTGEKASGEITLINCKVENESVTIPSGTTITAASSREYTTVGSVSVPRSDDPGETCDESGTASVQIQAAEIGKAYNVDTPTDYTVEGYDDSEIWGQGGGITGGSTEEVPVVIQKDIQNTRQQLLEQERESVRSTLRNQFGDGQYIIDASFQENVTEVTSEPAEGEEVEGNARLILQVTYTLMGVLQSDMESLLEYVYRQQVENGQKLGVIDNGMEEIQLERNQEGDMSYFLQANGVLGPDIPADELKNQIAGMSYGETIEHIEAKPNVTTAEVNLSPLWVTSVPENHKKIKIIFEVADPDGNDTGD